MNFDCRHPLKRDIYWNKENKKTTLTHARVAFKGELADRIVLAKD